MLCEESSHDDDERVLEEYDGCELGGEHEIGDGRSGRRRTGAAFHGAGARFCGLWPARSVATCWR